MAVSKVTIQDVIGSFNALTVVIKAELLGEYKANRITGDKYADVYSALMAQAMQQAVGFVIQAQQGDANAELIAQKVITEKAQVQDKIEELENITDAHGTVEGSIGKQKDVYDAQIKGFENDAVNKAVKLMTDIWGIQRSTDNEISPNPENKLYDSNIGSAITKLYTQVGIELEAAPNVAYVVIESTAGGATVPANGSVSIRGSIGDGGQPDTKPLSISITDSAGTSIAVTVPDLVGKVFTISSQSVASLAAGTLTCIARIRSTDGSEIVVTDTIEKLA